MIDPKMVELIPFDGIPHLRIPVVSDPKKAAGALQEMVYEMEKRYRMFMERGVKDIATYNESAHVRGDIPPLPRIVIIVDELADLMMSAAKEVEDSIVRIAQKARAAGMHLIIATQRPSADVITGIMKANIPSRIAFKVASQLESRIILDTMGAEKLVGLGDMLYCPVGAMKPQRVQGCLITEREVEAVVAAVKKNAAQPEYDQELMETIERRAEQVGAKGGGAKAPAAIPADGGDDDALLPAAVEIVLETGQASASMLQRRLKLGYARASRLVDQMEEKGIVGPFEGSKPRQILITKQEWDGRENQ
jgi:S-DNA-T family DNA segregation ATPase FtsK/SpoIIIE